jgi:integrase/recombinase XerC
LIAQNLHDGSLSSLHHLIAQNTLEGQLEALLVTCQVEGLSPHTLNYYRYQVGAFIRFCRQFDITEPGQVTADEIRLFILSLQQHNNPVSVHDYFRAIKRFFNWLVEQKTIPQSPMKEIKAPKVPKYIIHPLSRRDIGALLVLTDGDRFLQLRNRSLVLMFLDTGLRLSEMAAIRLTDIDMDRGTIRVMGKGARERLVRIGTNAEKALLKYLLQRRDNLPALWLSEERQPLTIHGIQSIIKVLFRRAEITGA